MTVKVKPKTCVTYVVVSAVLPLTKRQLAGIGFESKWLGPSGIGPFTSAMFGQD